MNFRTRLAGLEKRRDEVDRAQYRRTIDAILQRPIDCAALEAQIRQRAAALGVTLEEAAEPVMAQLTDAELEELIGKGH